MSSTASVSGSSQSITAQLLQQLRQAQAQKTASATSSDAASSIAQFFQTSDTNSDGQLSQSELTTGLQQSGSLLSGSTLLQASTASSGDTAQDAIKALIDSIKSTLDATQSADTSATDGKSAFQQTLFKQLDGDGDGTITKDEVESAVTKAGGTKASADALYAKLDPDNTGSVTEQQFAQNISPPPPQGGPPPGGGGGGDTASASNSSGTTDPLDTNQDGTVSLAERLAGLGISSDSSTTDSDSVTADSSTDDTKATQNFLAQLRKDMMNFLISLQSKTENSATGGVAA